MFSDPDRNRIIQSNVDFNVSTDCEVIYLDQSNPLAIDNNSSHSIPSEPSLLDCHVVLDKVQLDKVVLDKTHSAPSHRSIEVGYLDSIC